MLFKRVKENSNALDIQKLYKDYESEFKNFWDLFSLIEKKVRNWS